MTKEQLIQGLYNEMSSLDTRYMWVVGSLIAIIGIVVGFYSYQQWKFSEKGIEHMKKKFKKELHDEFYNEFSNDFKKKFGIDELNNSIEIANLSIKRNKVTQKKLNKYIDKTIGLSIELESALLESVRRDSSVIVMTNRLKKVYRTLGDYGNRVDVESLFNSATSISNSMHNAIKCEFVGNDEFIKFLKKLRSLFNNASERNKETVNKEIVNNASGKNKETIINIENSKRLIKRMEIFNRNIDRYIDFQKNFKNNISN